MVNILFRDRGSRGQCLGKQLRWLLCWTKTTSAVSGAWPRNRRGDRGNALVEFALVFPAWVFLAAGMFSCVLLGARQIALDGRCARLARELSQTPAEDSFRIPAGAELRIRPVPVERPASALRFPSEPHVLDVTLHHQTRFLGRPIRLSSTVSEFWVGRVQR